MSDPKPPAHPVQLALEGLEQAIEGCKNVALSDALSDTEGAALQTITNGLLTLWDEFCDRQIANTPNIGNVISDEEIEEAEGRVYQRLVAKLVNSKEPHLQKIALMEMDEEDLNKC